MLIKSRFFFSGLYFEKHLKFIQLNNVVVPFTQMDLSYLLKVCTGEGEFGGAKIRSIPIFVFDETTSDRSAMCKKVVNLVSINNRLGNFSANFPAFF